MNSASLRVVTMLVLLVGGSAWVRPRGSAAVDPGVRFEEIAGKAGCLNQHTMVELSPRFSNIMPWLSSVGAAVAAADFDGDGRTDLYVTNSGRGSPNRLFRARGDRTFEDVAQRAGVACGNPVGACVHAIFGDVDGDGRPDLYVTKWAAPNQLFRNRGDGTFEDVTQRAGVGYWGYGNAATFVDFDRDGRLDILLGNYFSDSLPDPRTGRMARSDLWNPVTTRVMHSTFTHADNGGKTVLYRNRGDGTFEDVAERMGLTFRGWTLSVGAADLNDDGWPDLYLSNDFGPDELYLNTGSAGAVGFRRVVDTSGHPGIGNDWWKGMNIDFGDVDGNGALDLYVTNIRARRYKSDEGNMLWLNEPEPRGHGERRFRDVAAEAGVDDGGWGWGGKFLDVNDDGLLDVFTVNGFVTGDASHTYWYALQEMVTQTKNNAADATDWPVMGNRDLSGRERSRLFVQVPPERASARAPRFVDVAAAAGITDDWNGRGIAILDLDDDGALDLYVANQGAPSVLYHNRGGTQERHWLGLALEGRPDHKVSVGDHGFASTTDAIGARVELVADGKRQIREVSGGTGYSSQSERRIHFGLGPSARPERLSVRWPSGSTQTFNGAALAACVDGYARLVEDGALEPKAGGARGVASAVRSAGARGSVAGGKVPVAGTTRGTR
jgi:enediyne biosynthesis protein E4